jgi:hypothetical protein
MRNVGLCTVILASLVAPRAHAAVPGGPAVATGFENPESAHWDHDSQAWYVSSWGGVFSPGAVDGNGFISKLAADGTVSEHHWLMGLNSPSGIDTFRGTLYTADVGELVAIDIATRQVLRKIALDPPTTNANDVAVDPVTEDVYVSALTDNTVYRIVEGRGPVEAITTADLEAPDGLLVEGRSLLIGGFGRTFAGEPSLGRLLRMDLGSRAITPASDPIGFIDGVESLDDAHVVSDYATGRILVIDGEGHASVGGQFLPTSADIGIDHDHRVIAVPEGALNIVWFVPL